MVSQMINAHEVEDLLRQMEVLSRRLVEAATDALMKEWPAVEDARRSRLLGLLPHADESLQPDDGNKEAPIQS